MNVVIVMTAGKLEHAFLFEDPTKADAAERLLLKAYDVDPNLKDTETQVHKVTSLDLFDTVDLREYLGLDED